MHQAIHRALEGVLLSCAVLASACSGGGGGSEEPTAALSVALTDAASDELASFVVDVVSIELERSGGARVGVLPDPVTVDLLTLEETSQILNVMNVPAGRYTAADVTFDFSAASAYLIGESNPATIVDGDGLAIPSTLTLPISIGNLLDAQVGRHRILELDFDLDQSVLVDAATNTVAVEPTIVMRVDRNDPKDLVLGGDLVAFDSAQSTFDLELRGPNGALVAVVADAATVYQINGAPSQGASGFADLTALATGTWVQVYGDIDPLEARIEARYVEAGTGTYNGGSDIVEGHVVGRVGGAGGDAVLMVLGHSNNAAHTSFNFNTTFTVSTSFANTTVVRRGALQSFDTDDINIGQRVRVFGALSGTTLDASLAQDVVRLQPTRILGYADDAIQGNELGLDLVRVGLRDEAAFLWSEGGTTPVDPDAVVADVAGLGTGLGIMAGTAVEVVGFFSAVDDDLADFLGTSVINRDLAPSLMLVTDRTNGMSIQPTVSASEIRFAISGSPVFGEFTLIDRGLIGALPLPATPEPTVVPQGGLGIFVLRDRTTGAVSLHLDFADFATALDGLLAQGAVIYNFAALGSYDETANSLSVGLIGVALD